MLFIDVTKMIFVEEAMRTAATNLKKLTQLLMALTFVRLAQHGAASSSQQGNNVC